MAVEEESRVRAITCHGRQCRHAGPCPGNSCRPTTTGGQDGEAKAQRGNVTPPKATRLGCCRVGVSTPLPNQYPVLVFGACELVSLQDIQLGRVPRRRQMGTRGPSSGREDGEGHVWKGAVCARLACGSAQAAEVLNEGHS